MRKAISSFRTRLTMLAVAILLTAACGLAFPQNVQAKGKPIPPKGMAPINGAKLYYETAGKGFPVILLHGTTLDCRMWDDQFQEFAKHYKVVRYDMRGHGKSDDPKAGAPYSHVGDLNVLMEYLKVDKAALVGLSNGGKVAIAFSLVHPEKVASLAVADSVIDGFSYFGNGGFLTRFIKVFREGRKGNLKGAMDLWVADPLFAPALRNPEVAKKLKKIVYEYKGYRFLKKDPLFWPKPASINRLCDIETPTLVILGSLDLPDMNAIAQIIATQVKGAEFKKIKDCGHMSNMEKPAEFNLIVLDFLAAKLPKPTGK